MVLDKNKEAADGEIQRNATRANILVVLDKTATGKKTKKCNQSTPLMVLNKKATGKKTKKYYQNTQYKMSLKIKHPTRKQRPLFLNHCLMSIFFSKDISFSAYYMRR